MSESQQEDRPGLSRLAILGIAVAIGLVVGIGQYIRQSSTAPFHALTNSTHETAGLGASEVTVPTTTASEKIAKEARIRFPNLNPAVAYERVARDRTESDLLNVVSAEERFAYAADRFWIYVFYRTDAIRPRCQAAGVDIAPYITAFTNANMEVFPPALVSLTKRKIPVDELIAASLPALKERAESEFKATATMLGLSSDAEVCHVYNQNSAAIASELAYSQTRPVAHYVLTHEGSLPP